jgi:hypothetical protein
MGRFKASNVERVNPAPLTRSESASRDCWKVPANRILEVFHVSRQLKMSTCMHFDLDALKTLHWKDLHPRDEIIRR